MASNEEMFSGDFKFLILNPDNGGVLDLFKFLAFDNEECGAKFLETSHSGVGDGGEGVTPDHRWVIVVSIIVRKIIKVIGKPLEWFGYLLEFLLNLLSLNGNFMGLLYRILQGNVTMPKRDSETFISAIGHLDGRIDLYKSETPLKEVSRPDVEKKTLDWQIGNRNLMDLCMMASKLAYENAKVVRNVINLHWKMHFVDFYNCWNEYQKERSTQVFILCDKPKDANLILISFRGTEPFDADDWITDFDYSWYEIPQVGKLHLGFLEALGMGNRVNPSSFYEHLSAKHANSSTSSMAYASEFSSSSSDSNTHAESSQTSAAEEKDDAEIKLIPEMVEMTAYYVVRSKLKSLLKEHKNAQFVVTGHSLGAALALLFPTVLVLHKEEDIMQRLLSIYTFGQPRVGNRQLGRFMEARLEHPGNKYFRVVYNNDLVPRLPYDNKTFLYKHFGICLYYNNIYTEQIVDEEPNRNFFGIRYIIPAYLNAVWELLRSLIMGNLHGSEYSETWESVMLRVVGLALPGLSDHSPVDYVNSVRLGRMSSN